MVEALKEQVAEKSLLVNNVRREIDKILVGQRDLVDGLLIGLFTKGHILIEGVPGLAKTSAVKALASTVQADFKRIQFTPDLLPADLIGTEIYRPKTGDFTIKKGPVSHNIIHNKEAVIIPPEITVRSGLSDNATELFVLHAGSQVQVDKEKEGFLKIRFSKDKIGWIKKTDAKII